MDLGLTGRVAVVTGGTRGIGAETVRLLGEEGATALAVSRSAGIDVTALDAAEQILERLDGRAPDILVNNAGTSYAKPLGELSEEDWQLQWDLNVMASMRLMRAFVPQMAKRGWGRVVNVTPSAGKRPSLTNAAYAVGKAAQVSLSRVFADTHGGQGVPANPGTPGAVATEVGAAAGGLAHPTARGRRDPRGGRAGGPDGGGARDVARGGDGGPGGQGADRALRHAGGDRERRRLPLLRARSRRHRRQLVGRRRHGCNHRLKRRQSPPCHPQPASETCTPARWSPASSPTSAGRSCRRGARPS